MGSTKLRRVPTDGGQVDVHGQRGLAGGGFGKPFFGKQRQRGVQQACARFGAVTAQGFGMGLKGRNN